MTTLPCAWMSTLSRRRSGTLLRLHIHAVAEPVCVRVCGGGTDCGERGTVYVRVVVCVCVWR